MATMIDGESYLGRVLIRPLSQSGDTTLYLWPFRCLKSKMGGPTFGIDVKGKEILRFDPHGGVCLEPSVWALRWDSINS
jgi:hypothetical protein